jgi:hypothetical protein
MDPAQNKRLMDYFKGRQTWLVEPDAEEVRAVPYTGDGDWRPSAKRSLIDKPHQPN